MILTDLEMKDLDITQIEKRIAAVYEIGQNIESEWGKHYWESVLVYLLRQANRFT